MTTRTKIWLLPAFLYGVFVFWYTPTGGPLSDRGQQLHRKNGAKR